MIKSCAFTGHRYELKDFDAELLERVIKNLIISGVVIFYCGMAVGLDRKSTRLNSSH